MMEGISAGGLEPCLDESIGGFFISVGKKKEESNFLSGREKD